MSVSAKGTRFSGSESGWIHSSIAEISAYCESNGLALERVYVDQQTGKDFNRPRYQVLREDVLRSGDELIITEVDRLGRNKRETLKELQYYRDNNIRVKILELPTSLMDLSKLDNNMAQMLMETVNNMLFLDLCLCHSSIKLNNSYITCVQALHNSDKRNAYIA